MKRLSVVVALLAVLTGCSSEDGGSTAPATPAPPPTAAPSPSGSAVPSQSGSAAPSVIAAPTVAPSFDPQARIPIAPPTAPADLPGDDEEFLARTRGWLEALAAEAPAGDSRLVARGREVCSLLSGGGAVADKVDFVAGQRNLVEEGWTAVILGAIDTYCPELGPGYFAARADPPPATTPEEKLDLVRFEVRGLGTEPTFSDGRIRRLAGVVCRQVVDDPDALLADVTSGGDRETAVTTLAVVAAYCTEGADAFLDLLKGAAA